MIAQRRPTRDQRTRHDRHDRRTARPGRSAWPIPTDRPIDRARTLANAALDALAAADPAAADRIRTQAHQYGETWLGAAPQPAAGEWLTREDVARLAGVEPQTVSLWTTRGTRAGHLIRHPDGYAEREVVDYLAALRGAPPTEETP
ncbi:hypothetical protein [Pseudonocardia sp. NPDC049635]|uniref:hypothetical protein n=1 Tax=Pseudonocardia sp. NPDC049635 TaxID=3155506 RepID=UPI0033C38198